MRLPFSTTLRGLPCREAVVGGVQGHDAFSATDMGAYCFCFLSSWDALAAFEPGCASASSKSEAKCEKARVRGIAQGQTNTGARFLMMFGLRRRRRRATEMAGGLMAGRIPALNKIRFQEIWPSVIGNQRRRHGRP